MCMCDVCGVVCVCVSTHDDIKGKNVILRERELQKKGRKIKDRRRMRVRKEWKGERTGKREIKFNLFQIVLNYSSVQRKQNLTAFVIYYCFYFMLH